MFHREYLSIGILGDEVYILLELEPRIVQTNIEVGVEVMLGTSTLSDGLIQIYVRMK